MKEIVLSDESINSYGFRVLTSGIDLRQYEKNPIMLFMHNRPTRDSKDVLLPIGKMTNLRIDGDRLIGTPEFDMDDDFAAQIAGKYDRGYLNMASIGIDITETSQDPDLIMVGQTRPTVTQCRLREVSIVDIGSNDHALVIDEGWDLKAGSYVSLFFDRDNIVQPINNDNDMTTNVNVERILALLSLGLDAPQEEIEETISILSRKASQTEELLKEAEITRQQETATLINDAINDGRIASDNAKLFTDIAEKSGNQVLRETLALMKPSLRPTDLISPGVENTDPTWDEADKAGTLFDIKQRDPEQFRRMFDKKFPKR